MDSREQLLKSLMRDLETFQMPERWDAAKKAQVEKGRKGQKDIDAGRESIAENERLYQEALTKRERLQERISGLQTQIEDAKTKAAQDDPLNQAIQYGKSVGVPVAGYAVGHALGHKFGKGFDTDPKERAKNVKQLADKLRGINRASPTSRAETAAIVNTYDDVRKGRPAAQFLGPAALLGASAITRYGASQADDPYLKEGLNIAASAEQTGAVGMGLQQIIDTLRNKGASKKAINATDVADIEAARRTLNEKGKFNKLQGALQPPTPDVPPDTPPAAPPPKPGSRTDLYNQAKARGLPVTTRTKKADLESALAKALKASAKAAKESATKAIVPLSVGYGVYDSLRSPAEAGDGAAAAPMSRGEAAAYGGGAAAATGGAIKGVGSLMNSRLGQVLMRGAGRVLGPVGAGLTAYDVGRGVHALSHLSPPQEAGDYSTMGAFEPQQSPPAEDRFAMARSLPEPTGGPMPSGDDEDDFTALEQAASQDAELGEMIKSIILARVQEAQMGQVPNAMASQQIASQPAAMASALRSFAQR